MNEESDITTEEEKKAAVHEAVRNQIEMFRHIAKDMDENEGRIAVAILQINTARQLALLTMQVQQLTKMFVAATQTPTLVDPSGKSIVQ